MQEVAPQSRTGNSPRASSGFMARNPRLSPTSVIMKSVTSQALRRPLLATATGMVLLASGGIARASAPAEMLQAAETACLEKATSEGWRADQSSVVSRRSIDADRVEIVLDLSKDGVNKARLTCPYSASKGVMSLGDALKEGADRTDFGQDFSRSMATATDAAQAVNRSKAWWLLLPIGLAGLIWAALRGQAAEDDVRYGAPESPVGGRTADSFIAAANGEHGQAEIHELADQHSLVRRRVSNGQMVSLTGRSANGWLEVDGGGWVRESDLKIRQGNVAASARNR
jgi:hypothetical protein